MRCRWCDPEACEGDTKGMEQATVPGLIFSISLEVDYGMLAPTGTHA